MEKSAGMHPFWKPDDWFTGNSRKTDYFVDFEQLISGQVINLESQKFHRLFFLKVYIQKNFFCYLV
jgi:hypothetical protein